MVSLKACVLIFLLVFWDKSKVEKCFPQKYRAFQLNDEVVVLDKEIVSMSTQ